MDETIIKGDEGREELIKKLEAVQIRAAKMETKLVEKEEKEQEDAVIIRSLEAAKETLEKKVQAKEEKENEFKTAFMNLKKKITSLENEKEEGDGSREKAKMKKLTNEAKAKQKANDDLQEQLKQMTLKAAEETKRRVSVEVELTRSKQNVDRLLKIQEKEKSSSNNKDRDTVCRDWLKPTGCRYGAGCRWLHPQGEGGRGRESEARQGEVVKSADCKHWMNGYCMFPDQKCVFIHSKEKKGTTKQQNQNTNQNVNQNMNQKDFSETLAMVKEVRDAMAGGIINQSQQMQPQMMSQQQVMIPQMMNQQIQSQNQQSQMMNMLPQMMSQQQMQPMIMVQPMMLPSQGWGSQAGPQTRQ